MPKMLSKSRVIAGRQCQRRLWLEAHNPALRAYGPETLRRFAQGHRLNDLVHRIFPDGVLVQPDLDPGTALKQTATHLTRHPERPLFEATFSAHRVLVRADIFAKVDAGFQLTEVKSSTRVKPAHLVDCAIQAWVIAEAGYPVEQTVLAHIDPGFVYPGGGDYRGLLRHVDVTGQIAEFLPEIPGWVEVGLETLALPEEPAIAVGPHCSTPYPCPFIGHCSPPPAEYPVESLPGGGKVVRELIAEGIDDIRDIPAGRLRRPLHRRIRTATLRGIPFIDPKFGEILRALPHPRYFLDFESIQFAIPIWPDTRPYEQLPFQWSCHRETAAGTLDHADFLDTSGNATLRPCAEKLIDDLGSRGPIFTYSRFERDVINRLAARFPDLADALRALAERLVDLLPLVRAHYYHPAMRGSFSIKAVLPTVAPQLDYGALEGVHDGVGAQVAYEEAIDPGTPEARREALASQLREYCRLDTLAMVELVRFFSAR